jgi:HK97 family phage portal protein
MEWRVLKAEEGESPKPMPEHPLWRLLNDEPNPYMSGFTFRESLLTDCLLFGNAYAFIERDASARPIRLLKLRPDLMYVLRGPDNSPTYHYAAGTNGGHRELHGFDVFHLAGPGSDGLLGDPPIYLAREVIGLEIVATKFVAKFFQNGGRPAGALTTPGTLSPEALDRLRQSWQALHAGADNAGRVAILEAGMKFEKMAIDPNEAQLLELRSYCREQIAAAFGVPPHMVGDSAKQSYASAEQADIEYVKHCLGAWASRLEREVSRKLIVNDDGLTTRISFDELMRGDMAARFNSYNTALSAGFLSINEIRAREGLSPVDGGDRIRVPLNMQTLDPDANVAGDIPPADGPETAAPDATGGEAKPTASAGDSSDGPGLNGAQISAAKEILLAVTAKQIAAAAAETLLVACGLTPAMARTIITAQAAIEPSEVQPVPEATIPAAEAASEQPPPEGGNVSMPDERSEIRDDGCGTGSGGFKPGNTCGKEDGAGGDDDKPGAKADAKSKGVNKTNEDLGALDYSHLDVGEHEVHHVEDWKAKNGNPYLMNVFSTMPELAAQIGVPTNINARHGTVKIMVDPEKPDAGYYVNVIDYRKPGFKREDLRNRVVTGPDGKPLSFKQATEIYKHHVAKSEEEDKQPLPEQPKTEAPKPTAPPPAPPYPKPKLSTAKSQWKGAKHPWPAEVSDDEHATIVKNAGIEGEGAKKIAEAMKGKIHPKDPQGPHILRAIAEHGAHVGLDPALAALQLDGLGKTVSHQDGKLLTSGRRGSRGAHGLYHPVTGEIRLSAQSLPDAHGRVYTIANGTLAHELGHHVHMQRMTDAAADEWAAISKKGKTARVSAYARTSTGEHFCEAYRAWHSGEAGQKTLRDLEPEAYAYMKKLHSGEGKDMLLPAGQRAPFVVGEARWEGKPSK